MIFITLKLDNVLQQEEDKHKLSTLINNKSFTVANTSLSYRQINTLCKDKLFPEERSNKKGWRKFSLKELIFFHIVFELKNFGLPHDILKDLSTSFFKKPTAEIAINCVLIGAEMMLTLDKEGKTIYYDPPHFLLIGREETPVIQIRLNNVVNSINTQLNKKTILIKWSGRNYFWNKGSANISDSEREALTAIRNKDYNTIQFRKTDGQISLIRAGKDINVNQLSDTDILKLIKERDFQDINIVKRDGNLVSVKVEESIKPSKRIAGTK